MTEKKQITIYELLPLLRPGWVAMDDSGVWWWFREKPHASPYTLTWITGLNSECTELIEFNIKVFNGDWEDSLMEVK